MHHLFQNLATQLTEEATNEVKEPDVRKKRVRLGRGGERKKRKEQQEEDGEEAADTVTISRADWEELSEMKTVMQDVVERLAVVERVQKRGATSDEGGVPAKTKKLSLPTIKDKLFEHPHLVNLRHFHN